MGDHANGLQYLIVAVALAMLVGGGVLVLLLARALGRALGWTPRVRRWAGLVGGVAGLGLGLMLVIATFFETTWAPPPVLALTLPRGFTPRWVVLLEDPAAPTAIEWHGVEAPFHGRSATLAVPPGGVLRVRSLAVAGRGDTTVRWSDGSTAVGFAAMTPPAAVHATGLAAFERQAPGAPFPIDSLPEGPALVAYLRAHGG